MASIEIKQFSNRHPAEDLIDAISDEFLGSPELSSLSIQSEGQLWGLYVNGRLLGSSKNRYECDFAKAILQTWVREIWPE